MALNDINNKTPPDIDGAIKDLSKAAEELECDKAKPPVSDTKKALCNSIFDTIIQLAVPLRVATPHPNIFTSSVVLSDTKVELQAALDAMNAGTSTIILDDKKVKGALKNVKGALKILGKGGKKDPLELLTKASKDLSCDSGPGLENAQQALCDAVVDCIVAVASGKKITGGGKGGTTELIFPIEDKGGGSDKNGGGGTERRRRVRNRRMRNSSGGQ